MTLGSPFGAGGSWQELKRTKITASTDTISVSSLPNKRTLFVVYNLFPVGTTITARAQFNGITTTQYATRTSLNGAADGTNTATNSILLSAGSGATTQLFGFFYIINTGTTERAVYGENVGQNGLSTGVAPQREEQVGKWIGSVAIASVDIINQNAGSDFDINSEVVVYGSD